MWETWTEMNERFERGGSGCRAILDDTHTFRAAPVAQGATIRRCCGFGMRVELCADHLAQWRVSGLPVPEHGWGPCACGSTEPPGVHRINVPADSPAA